MQCNLILFKLFDQAQKSVRIPGSRGADQMDDHDRVSDAGGEMMRNVHHLARGQDAGDAGAAVQKSFDTRFDTG